MAAEAHRRVFGHAPTHPPGQAGHLEAQGGQHRLEQPVLLVAVAAAAAGHELGLKIAQLQRDGRAHQGVEVLEGDGGRVQPVQLGKHGQGRLTRTGIADAGEIGIEVHGRCHASHTADPAGTVKRRRSGRP